MGNKPFNEAEHPRVKGKFANKNKTSNPGELPSDTVADPAAQFESELQERLDRVYESREDALTAADDLETYEGGIGISRKGEGWGLRSLDESGFRSCDLPYDNDGNANYQDIDFAMDAPDDYRICDNMNSNQWRELQPVKDYLNGKTDSVELYSLMPAGYLQDAGEDEDSYVDASYLTVLCANKGGKPDWHSNFQDTPNGDDVVENVQNTLNTTPGLQAWPGEENGSVYVAKNGYADTDRLKFTVNETGGIIMDRENPETGFTGTYDTCSTDDINQRIQDYANSLNQR